MSGQTTVAETELINLNVVGPDNIVALFTINKHRPMRDLANIYCDIVGLPRYSVKFLYNGSPINGNDTATSMEVEDGDTIEAYMHGDGN